MEPTDKPPVKQLASHSTIPDQTVVDFLPDADEIERSPLPPAARITLYVVLGMLCSFLLWAAVFEIDQVVSARGRLVTPLPNVVIQPLETAIIQSIDVRVGQVVKKGALLATLDPTFTNADAADLQARLASLETQAKRLEAELTGEKSSGNGNDNSDSRLQARLAQERLANYRAQRMRLDQTYARLKGAVETNRQDQQILAGRVASLQEIEAMQQKLLAQQYGARVRLLEAQEKRQEVERDLQQAKSRAYELSRELAALEAERTAFDKSWRQKTMEDMLATQRERDTIREQLQKANKRRGLVSIVSPVDGVILDIAKRSQGSVLQTAETLFTIVPLGAELEAEIQIDSADVGYVKLGDPTRIKFDAYPFQRHGALNGEVRTISEDAFRREAASATSLDVFYMGRVNLLDTRLKGMKDQARLLPGMTLSAEIVVGKRTVISYLLWPLTKAFDESLREP